MTGRGGAEESKGSGSQRVYMVRLVYSDHLLLTVGSAEVGHRGPGVQSALIPTSSRFITSVLIFSVTILV